MMATACTEDLGCPSSICDPDIFFFFLYFLSSPLEQRLQKGKEDLFSSPPHVRHPEKIPGHRRCYLHTGWNEGRKERRHIISLPAAPSPEGLVCDTSASGSNAPSTEMLPVQLAQKHTLYYFQVKQFKLHLPMYGSPPGTWDGQIRKENHPFLPLKTFSFLTRVLVEITPSSPLDLLVKHQDTFYHSQSVFFLVFHFLPTTRNFFFLSFPPNICCHCKKGQMVLSHCWSS